MVRKIVEEEFAAVDFLADFPRLPIEAEDKFWQVLSYGLFWHEASNRWKRPLCDVDGRLLVSTSPTKSNECVQSKPAPTNVSSTVLSSNSSRKQMIIQNTGSVAVYLKFDDSAATTNDFKLDVGATLIDDVYYGEVRAITASGTGELRVAEYT